MMNLCLFVLKDSESAICPPEGSQISQNSLSSESSCDYYDKADTTLHKDQSLNDIILVSNREGMHCIVVAWRAML